MRKVRLNPRYRHLEDYILSLPEKMDTGDGGEMIHHGRNTIMMFSAPDGILLNVKRYHKPSLLNAFIYSSGIRKAKGLRAYLYPEILLAKDIETPESVAYIEERRWGIIRHSYYISIQCPYGHRLYEIGNAAPEVYEPLAEALAAMTVRMHENGVLHRDFSPGNILWDVKDGKYRFSIVDINRMYFGPVDMRMGCANFARLWGPKRFISLLVAEYARLRGFDVSECERITMERRSRFWKHYMKKRKIEFELEL